MRDEPAAWAGSTVMPQTGSTSPAAWTCACWWLCVMTVSVQQECPVEQHEPAATGAAVEPAYSAAAASNFVSQPRVRRWYVWPLWLDEPTAGAGSMLIPQTGSVVVVVVVVEWFMESPFSGANAPPTAVLHFVPRN